jgi:iron complex transport system substrate-binding protein
VARFYKKQNMKAYLYIIIVFLFTSSCSNNPKENIKTPQTSNTTLDIKYAKWFKINYHTDYKEITVVNPWTKAIYWKYQIYKNKVKSNTKNNVSILSLPQKTAVLSSTQIGMFHRLSILNRINAIANLNYVYNPSIRKAVINGAIDELGDGASLNVEKTYSRRVDIVFSTAWDKIDPKFIKLIKLNIPIAFVMDWQEESPLARAEWIKFVAAFFDMEKQACQIFDKIEKRYLTLKKISQEAKNKPTVLHGTFMSGVWYIAGGRSFVAQFYADANANYLWKEDSITGSLPLSFETVFEKAQNANYWINSSSYSKTSDFFAEDQRYQLFRFFKEKTIYTNGASLQAKTPNPFWEEGSVNPDQVLKDIIAILHPNLLPKHRLRYYRKIK